MNLDIYTLFYPMIGGVSETEIRGVLERGFDAGWSTTRDGELDTCAYTDPANNRYLERVPTKDAIDGLATRDGGITIFPATSDLDFRFKVHDSWSEWGLPGFGGISLTWPKTLFRSDAETTTTELFATGRLVYESLVPPLAFSYLPYEFERETTVTQDHLENNQLPDVFWAMFLSEPVCEQIGRDRLQTAPVWRVESLDDGGIGLIATANPMQYNSKHKERLRNHLEIGT